jgi:hypothetical protein
MEEGGRVPGRTRAQALRSVKELAVGEVEKGAKRVGKLAAKESGKLLKAGAKKGAKLAAKETGKLAKREAKKAGAKVAAEADKAVRTVQRRTKARRS